MKPVSELLKKHDGTLWHLRPEATVFDALQTLADYEVGALMVMDGGRLVGVLSERDVVAALADRGAGVLDEPAARLMTDEVVTCEPDTTIEWLMATMTERRIRHVPVVVDEQLAGLVSIGDVVKHHVAELEHETQAMREYITHPY